MSTLIPVVDFSAAGGTDPEQRAELSESIKHALTSTGFLALKNTGLSPDLIQRCFSEAEAFFSQPFEEKQPYAYRKASENFGYLRQGDEYLDPGAGADVKESFTMRYATHYNEDASRWPSESFRRTVLDFYAEGNAIAHRMLCIFDRLFDKEPGFFSSRHCGENITMRVLHYPVIDTQTLNPDQLGAGAHTDYGTITLLFQDGVSGLEVCDKDGYWHTAPADKDLVVINTGDLMARWSNDTFRSTPHRVQPRSVAPQRYSIALFIDPDSAVEIETLPNCITAERPNRYTPVSAGEHIQAKIEASQQAAKQKQSATEPA